MICFRQWGSTNLDFRSFEHNFEVNAFMYDMETALQMREIFLQDQREMYSDFPEELGKTFFASEGNGVCSSIIGSVAIRKTFFNLSEEGKI